MVLYAITNIFTTIASVFFAGMLSDSISAASVVFGFVFGIANVVLYGWIRIGSLFQGLQFVFVHDIYSFWTFLIGLSSWIGMLGFHIIQRSFFSHTTIVDPVLPVLGNGDGHVTLDAINNTAHPTLKSRHEKRHAQILSL